MFYRCLSTGVYPSMQLAGGVCSSMQWGEGVTGKVSRGVNRGVCDQWGGRGVTRGRGM